MNHFEILRTEISEDYKYLVLNNYRYEIFHFIFYDVEYNNLLLITHKVKKSVFYIFGPYEKTEQMVIARDSFYL